MNHDKKNSDLAFQDEVVSNHKRRWTRGTAKLKVGVALATTLMLLYSLLPYVIASYANHDTTSGRLLLYILYIGIAIVLAFLCGFNYLRGLVKFSNLFEQGGRRSLRLIRWGFYCSAVGILVQFFVFWGIRIGEEGITFLHLLIGNLPLLAAAVLSIVGFLSLATVRGMTDDGRRGALHMAWTTLVMLAGALLFAFALHRSLAIQFLTTIVIIAGACLFYAQWKRILAYPTDEQQEEPAQEAPNQEQ